MAEIIAETVRGEACKTRMSTITTSIKMGMTENRKLKAHAPANDKSLFCKKYLAVRKILCEKVINVNLRGDFVIRNRLI